MKEIIKECLGRFNLQVNEEKTESSTIQGEQGKKEKRRWIKHLGNLIDDYQDMKRREHLLIIALASANKIWKSRNVNIRTSIEFTKKL